MNEIKKEVAERRVGINLAHSINYVYGTSPCYVIYFLLLGAHPSLNPGLKVDIPLCLRSLIVTYALLGTMEGNV